MKGLLEDRAKIEAVDAAIELTDAGGWYDGEIRETWPAFTTTRYLAPGAVGLGTRLAFYALSRFGEIEISVAINEKRIPVQNQPNTSFGLRAEHRQTVLWLPSSICRFFEQSAVDGAKVNSR